MPMARSVGRLSTLDSSLVLSRYPARTRLYPTTTIIIMEAKTRADSQTTGSPPRDYPRSDRSILSVARIPFDSTLYTRAACAPSEHRSTPVHTDRRETPLASSFNPRTGVCPRLTARLSPFQRVLFLFVKYKLSTQTLSLTHSRPIFAHVSSADYCCLSRPSAHAMQSTL